MPLSLEDRRADVCEMFRAYDLSALEGVEFQRLFRLAHEEGRLFGFLRDIEAVDCQGIYRPHLAVSGQSEEIGNPKAATA